MAPVVDISVFCRDLDDWPRSWMGVNADLVAGSALLPYLRAFIEHLVLSELAPRTIRRHVDNLWSIGGEIIRDLHWDPSLRKRSGEELLRKAVHEFGGPRIHNGSEAQQRSVDATARILHRFLSSP